MDPPIKLFGQTIVKPTLSAVTTLSGEGEEAEAVPTTSSGGRVDLPSSSQEVKDTVPESSGVVEISGSGVTCTRQDPKAGSIPDLTSSASNSAEEEKCCVSPRGGALGGSGAADENRIRHLTPPVSQGDGGGGDDENSEDDGSQANERGKKDGGAGGGGDNDMGKGGEKNPRRPENAVACPRCHSLETKFCYYNNYNVNQPRHFCKHCQRYWTAGGTLRNVPVGAGRRKNKHGSTIAPRGQTPEVGTVRSDAPDIASPLIVTKGVVPVPIQVSVVHATGGKAGVLRMAVPDTSDPSVLPFLRMQSQQMDPASVFVTSSSEAVPSSDTGTVACKRSRIANAAYSEASTGASDMEQQQSQAAWGQAASTGRDEPACSRSPVASSNNMNGHEMKVEAGPGRPMMGVAASPVPIPLGGGGPEQAHHPGTNNTTVVGPGVWSGAGPQATGPPPGAAAGPFGFYNGGWPYGFNVGWSGPAAFCAGGVAPGGTAVGGPPPPGNIAAAWNGSTGSVWAGVPWPMPGLAWAPAWPMAPWAMTPGPGGTQTISMGSAGVHTAPAPGGTTPAAAAPPPLGAPPSSPSSSLGKHPRAGPPSGAVACNGAGAPGGGGRGKMEGNGGLWAPKSLRMADPEEAIRSSVWRILGVGTRSDMTTGSTFKAFQPRNESKKVSDDDQQAAQASLHANPAAMSRSMNFHESN